MLHFPAHIISAALARNDIKLDERLRITSLLPNSETEFVLRFKDIIASVHNHDIAKSMPNYPEELRTLDNLCLVDTITLARVARWSTTFEKEIPFSLFAVCFILGKPPDFEHAANAMRQRVRGLCIDDDFRTAIAKQVRATALANRAHEELMSIINSASGSPAVLGQGLFAPAVETIEDNIGDLIRRIENDRSNN